MPGRVSEECPELFQLLGAWLHQDFDLDHPSADHALRESIAISSEERLLGATAEMGRSRPPSDDEDSTRRFVNALCDYHPPGDGLTYVSWLDHVEELMTEALEA